MADDLGGLRDFAEAGERVFGPEDKARALLAHHCRPGSWLCMGGWVALAVFYFTHWAVWIVALLVMAAGWAGNEWEERKIRARIRTDIAAGR